MRQMVFNVCPFSVTPFLEKPAFKCTLQRRCVKCLYGEDGHDLSKDATSWATTHDGGIGRDPSSVPKSLLATERRQVIYSE